MTASKIAAWNVFGDSYRYRQKYYEYVAKRREAEKNGIDYDPKQVKFDDLTEANNG